MVRGWASLYPFFCRCVVFLGFFGGLVLTTCIIFSLYFSEGV